MPTNPCEPPKEDDKLRLYTDVSFLYIILFCERCQAFLEPDDLASQEWPERLAERAIREGWLIEEGGEDYRVLCPTCAAGRNMSTN